MEAKTSIGGLRLESLENTICYELTNMSIKCDLVLGSYSKAFHRAQKPSGVDLSL